MTAKLSNISERDIEFLRDLDSGSYSELLCNKKAVLFEIEGDINWVYSLPCRPQSEPVINHYRRYFPKVIGVKKRQK